MNYIRLWGHRIRQAFHLYGRHKAHHWAATITLFAFMGLFPLALYLTILIRFLPESLLLRLLAGWLPEQAAQTVARQLHRIGHPGWVEWLLSFLGVVLSISHILHSVIEISDDFYRFPGRPFWKRRLMAMGIMVVFSAWQLLTLVFYSVSDWVWQGLRHQRLVDWRVLAPHVHWIGRVTSMLGIMVLHWLSLILLFGMSAPRFRWREQIPGATFTTLAWWIASQLLTVYLRLVPIANIYGALTGMLVFILWVYYAATLLIVGIGINASIAQETS